MVIKRVEQISSEVMKITSDTESAFFLRIRYLSLVEPDKIAPGTEFLSDSEDDLLDAALAYSAEVKATEYLSRSEQCRFGLYAKLLKKKHQNKHIEMALDYLEGEGLLSDYRFSVAWLNLRKMNHFEGRSRLSLELLSRGIKKEDAEKALELFFSENSEEEMCRLCLGKLLRTTKNPSEEKIIRSMMQKGFSLSLARRIIGENLGSLV